MNPAVKTGDETKLRADVVPWAAFREVQQVLTDGGNARAAMGWRQTPNAVVRYSGALFRHFLDFMTGSDKDKDSGKHPLIHCAANALILVDLVVIGSGQKTE